MHFKFIFALLIAIILRPEGIKYIIKGYIYNAFKIIYLIKNLIKNLL